MYNLLTSDDANCVQDSRRLQDWVSIARSKKKKKKKGRRVNLLILVGFDSGRSLCEGVGSALELAADLARKSTPARNVKFRHILNGLGKGIGRTLDLRGVRDSTLHLTARLFR